MKGWIKCIIAGAVIIVVGLALTLGALACNGWTVKKPEFEMLNYTATDDNTAMDVTIGAGSVKTEFYDGDKVTIDYPAANVFKSEISETDGVLHYQSRLRKTWFWGTLDIPDTVIKLPKGINFDLDFELNAGSVNVASGEYGKVSIQVHAGKLTVNQSTSTNFDCDVSAGLLEVNGLNCTKFDCEVSAGRLDVKTLECPDITADVSAGALVINVNGAKADYDIKTDVSAGSCNVSNQTGNGGKRLYVECSAGSADVTFTS